MEHFIFSLYIINFILLTNFGVSICCTTFEQSFTRYITLLSLSKIPAMGGSVTEILNNTVKFQKI